MRNTAGRADPRESHSLEDLTMELVRQHAALRRSASRLIEAVVALTDPDRGRDLLPSTVRDEALGLIDQLSGHFDREENLLFPAFHLLAAAERERTTRPSLPYSTVLFPIRVMEADHMRLDAGFRHLRRVLEDPPDVSQSDTWRRCLAAVSELEAMVLAHQRRENEILFPLALEVEGRLEH